MTKKQNQDNKSNKKQEKEHDTQQAANPGVEQPANNNPHNSAIYRKDPKTGKWIVKNPSGSMSCNYLYGDEWEY
ncbi:MAG: hypothetical protein KAW12_18215 [Candidatus Aminicenantes bacterium]|nr:hypothetical protein [Candidatus Aminicenantes bacterium]